MGFFGNLFKRGAGDSRPAEGAPSPRHTQRRPPRATIYFADDKIWLHTRSVNFKSGGRAYHIPAAAFRFSSDRHGREALLKILLNDRDLWTPGDEAALIDRLIRHADEIAGPK